MLELGQMLQ